MLNKHTNSNAKEVHILPYNICFWFILFLMYFIRFYTIMCFSFYKEVYKGPPIYMQCIHRPMIRSFIYIFPNATRWVFTILHTPTKVLYHDLINIFNLDVFKHQILSFILKNKSYSITITAYLGQILLWRHQSHSITSWAATWWDGLEYPKNVEPTLN